MVLIEGGMGRIVQSKTSIFFAKTFTFQNILSVRLTASLFKSHFELF